MRLINSTSLRLHEFFDNEVPEYAILSHCWNRDEVSYREYLDIAQRDPSNPKLTKIVECCSLAKERGLDWIWVDTCCIDKSSSAELSEAINSMFAWYERSKDCFVFLTDLTVTHVDQSALKHRVSNKRLSECRWFTRGWTLQELIAPRTVRFYASQNTFIGTKESLATELQEITQIPVDILTRSSNFKHASVAQRMSWASERSTTRTEDLAYCLLGLFEVNIPLLYGEGAKAFQRLQQAIISQSDDESIFAWVCNSADRKGVLARSPSDFAHTGNMRSIYFERKRPPTVFTSRGLEIHYAYAHPLMRAWDLVSEAIFGRLVLLRTDTLRLRLDCDFVDNQGNDFWVGISLRRDPTTGNWFREDPSKLLYMSQYTIFRRVYPAFVGYKKIYVDITHQVSVAGTRLIRTSSNSFQSKETSKYSRSILMSLVWTAAIATAAPIHVWLVSVFHSVLQLPEPNRILTWTYLTGHLIIMGQHFGIVLACLFVGLTGWDMSQSNLEYRTTFTAFLGLVPISCLQLFETGPWRDMEVGPALKARFAQDTS